MRVLKLFNLVIKNILILSLCTLFICISYILYSNIKFFDLVATQYQNIQESNSEGEIDLELSLEKLSQINSDVISWIMIEDTNINYPILHGEDNLYYMNHDIYKNISLAGSIFMDYRNQNLINDRYIIIYGHHLDKGLMFGDLDKFAEEEFFYSAHNVTISVNNELINYKVLSKIDLIDGTKPVFDVEQVNENFTLLSEFLVLYHDYVNIDTLTQLINHPKNSQIIALVTCTEGFTGMRRVIFLYRELDIPDDVPPETPPDDIPPDEPLPEDPPDDIPPINPPTADIPILFVFGILIISLSLLHIIIKGKRLT